MEGCGRGSGTLIRFQNSPPNAGVGSIGGDTGSQRNGNCFSIVGGVAVELCLVASQ